MAILSSMEAQEAWGRGRGIPKGRVILREEGPVEITVPHHRRLPGDHGPGAVLPRHSVAAQQAPGQQGAAV